MIFISVLVVVIFMAFCVVHLVCSTNKGSRIIKPKVFCLRDSKYFQGCSADSHPNVQYTALEYRSRHKPSFAAISLRVQSFVAFEQTKIFWFWNFSWSVFKEAEMLIEADLAAQNEKYLTRLGRLNPLPINKGLVLSMTFNDLQWP